MKNIKIVAILLICSAFSFTACNDKAESRKKEAREQLELANPSTTTNNTITPPPTTPPVEPAQNAAGVWHYTCSNGCAGGAGAKGNCATCGNPLAHNQAYHANNNTTTTSPTTTQINPPLTPPTPPKVEPAQNAAGVWHYTCANGCAGGSGAQGNCGTCGGALAHNSAYHQ